jgi:hypothetical protein
MGSHASPDFHRLLSAELVGEGCKVVIYTIRPLLLLNE